MENVSAIVITLNEQDSLGACLQSLPGHWEKIVVDSGSSDKTCSLAESFGAKVYQRAFDDYASQKNYAVSKSSNDWVFVIDADEWSSSELNQAIEQVLLAAPRCYAYQVPRRLRFMGRVMRHGKSSDNPIRLFRKDKAQFIGAIHEVLQVEDNNIGYLSIGYLTHDSYENLDDYFQKFNRYTSSIASEHYRKGRKSPRVVVAFRPWYEFLERYLIRLGFLDGYPGYVYALVSSFYAFIKYAKLLELSSHHENLASQFKPVE